MGVSMGDYQHVGLMGDCIGDVWGLYGHEI